MDLKAIAVEIATAEVSVEALTDIQKLGLQICMSSKVHNAKILHFQIQSRLQDEISQEEVHEIWEAFSSLYQEERQEEHEATNSNSSQYQSCSEAESNSDSCNTSTSGSFIS